MQESLPKNARQVLLNLTEGNMLQFRRSPQGYFKIAAGNTGVWQKFHRRTLLYSLNTLYKRGFADIQEGLDGITVISATEAGRAIAAELGREVIAAQRPEEWDKKWRLILFDVPETKKKFREAFRYQLRRLGFVEFQRSAFLFPFPCGREIDALAERLQLKEHVVMITAESVSNEFHYKKVFGLL